MNKPVVYFKDEPYFVDGDKGSVAYVHALNHPKLGDKVVRTSLIVEKISDDEFHTLNSIYKRKKTDD